MSPLVLIPMGTTIGLIIPLLSIAFATVTFYASMDAVGRLRRRRQKKLRTAQDSLIEIGFAPNVVNSLIVLDQGRSPFRGSSAVSGLDVNANPLDPDYVLELKRNQEKVTELKERVALLRKRLNVLKGVESVEELKSPDAKNDDAATTVPKTPPTVVPKAKVEAIPKTGASPPKKDPIAHKTKTDEVIEPKIENVKSTKTEPLKESARKNSVTTTPTTKQNELSSRITDRKVSKDEQKTAKTVKKKK